MKDDQKRIAVIGGGVSGIASAHYLIQKGYGVDLYESRDRLGGRISIGEISGEEVCFGGKNIGLEYTEFRKFLSCYGKPHYEYFGINSARLIRGKVTSFNSRNKIKSLLTLWRSGTLSDLIKLNTLLKRVKNNRRNGDTNSPIWPKFDRRNIAELFSKKFADSIIRALTVRMNGAEPNKIAVENFGTHLQMLQDEYEQLETPLSDFFKAFAENPSLQLYLNTPITQIVKSDQGYELHGEDWVKPYHSILISLPAISAKTCLETSFPELAKSLAAVQYFPVAVIIADYDKDVFPTNIRALTFGPDCVLSNMGAYGLTSLNRVRYTFSGEEAAELLLEALDDDYLLSAAEAQARPYFNLDNNPCTAYKVRYWEKGLCGYTRDEALFQSNLRAALNPLPGLELTGDYQKGASIENCFRAAKEAACHLAEQIETDCATAKISPVKTGPAYV